MSINVAALFFGPYAEDTYKVSGRVSARYHRWMIFGVFSYNPIIARFQ